MITCHLEEITEVADKALRRWAADAAAQTMLSCVKALADSKLLEAANQAMVAQFEPGKLMAGLELDKAKRYTIFLEVWTEILTNQGRPKIASIQQS